MQNLTTTDQRLPSAPQMRKGISPRLWRKTTLLLNACKTCEQFYARCSPARIHVLEEHRHDEAQPTLTTLDIAYGEAGAKTWVAVMLYFISEFAGAKDKVNAMQVEYTATTIDKQFGFLSIGEFAHFINLLLSGRWGKFYGAIDPVFIMESLHKYCGEIRVEELRALEEQREERERREHEKAVITAAQFCHNVGLAEDTDLHVHIQQQLADAIKARP